MLKLFIGFIPDIRVQMKRLLLLTICCFLSTLLSAQTAAPPTITISGTVIDSATNKPLGFVTVALQNSKTHEGIKSGLTTDNGGFALKIPAGDSYQAVFVFIGYKTKTVPISGTGTERSLGRILLSASTGQLKEVSITSARPLMKQEVDRISYDVQADPESKSVTALDMMRKVPLLSVDASDNIKLRGSSNYKILINGKESALMARNPSDILKAMPGTNIVKIEVITTPPAKYDAEGLAGIINIITVKNADQGYNGSANINYNSVYGYRLNLNTTVKQGKLGFTGYVGTGKRESRSSETGSQSIFYDPASSLTQNGTRSNGGKNTYVSTELSYEIDTLNLLTGMFDLYNNNNNQGTTQFTNLRDGNNNITESYRSLNNGTGQYHGSDVGLNYQLSFKNHKDELLTASYKYSNNNSKQFSDVSTQDVINYQAPDYRQYNNSGSKEHTLQLDYIQPLKVVTIEAGGKMILRNNFSNFHTDTLTGNNQYTTDPKQENDFTYHQDVYSLYNSYQLKFTKWVLKGGLRLERTNISANFISASGTNLDQRYNNLVPSLSIQRSLKNSSLTFGFTQRIQRPGIYQLNPFVDSTNRSYITRGNPALRPAVNNTFELGYSNFAKGSINISTNYAFANNTIESLASVNGAVTTTTFANVGKNRHLGFDVNINYPITTRLNVNINAELLQIWLKGTYNGAFLSNSGQQGHLFTYTGYKFDDGYRIGVNIGYDSRYVLLQGRDNFYFFSGANVSKEIFNKKASFSVNFNNPFSKFNKLDFFTKTSDFQTSNYFLNYYRTLNLNFSYKFGKLNSTIKKNQRGINNDDTSGGSKN